VKAAWPRVRANLMRWQRGSGPAGTALRISLFLAAWMDGQTQRQSPRAPGGTHNYLMKGKLIGGLVAGPA